MPSIIGLMSGTSLDGVDAVQVNLTGTRSDLQMEVLAGLTYPYPDALRSRLLALCAGETIGVAELAELDDAVAHTFAQAALTVQQEAIDRFQTPAVLIGSHGQTLYHRPPTHTGKHMGLGYSWQLGRGSVIAYQTRLPTVSNFRSADIAAGGQGAPLVPAIDRYWFGHPEEHRCIQNIGGIGNVTYLPPWNETNDRPVQGWDTGPGNSLLDLAVQRLSQGTQRFDAEGQWAAQGMPCVELLEQWLAAPFFHQAPPKSTGRELFGTDYLDRCCEDAEAYGLGAADFLATLTELTALSIYHSYRSFLPYQPQRIFVAGGGLRNEYLMQRLRHHFAPIPVDSTIEEGVDPDLKEAAIFAVLAYWHQLGLPGNLPSVTGATQAVILGDYSPVYSVPDRPDR